MSKDLFNINRIKSALDQYIGDKITSDFDLNKDLSPVKPKLRDAAVLIPIIIRPDGLNIILTKRSNNLQHHPGQIAFPGGKVDGLDNSLIDTALREAHEEIGLMQKNIEILGLLPKHETITNFKVTPVVGLVDSSYQPRIEPGEVDEIFEVPFTSITNSKNFQINYRVWGKHKRGYYSMPYGPYYIWGATARIMRMFCDILDEFNETK